MKKKSIRYFYHIFRLFSLRSHCFDFFEEAVDKCLFANELLDSLGALVLGNVAHRIVQSFVVKGL